MLPARLTSAPTMDSLTSNWMRPIAGEEVEALVPGELQGDHQAEHDHDLVGLRGTVPSHSLRMGSPKAARAMTIGNGDGHAHQDRSEEVPGLAGAVAHRVEVGEGGQQEIGALGAEVPVRLDGAQGDVIGGDLGHGQDEADDHRVELVGDDPTEGDHRLPAAEAEQIDQHGTAEVAMADGGSGDPADHGRRHHQPEEHAGRPTQWPARPAPHRRRPPRSGPLG